MREGGMEGLSERVREIMSDYDSEGVSKCVSE